jgi:hypothetical protein
METVKAQQRTEQMPNLKSQAPNKLQYQTLNSQKLMFPAFAICRLAIAICLELVICDLGRNGRPPGAACINGARNVLWSPRGFAP